MIDELIKVSTEILSVSDRFEQAGKAQKQRIAQYFHSIESCLQGSADILKDGAVPYGQWGELETYGWELVGAIGKEIGEEQARSLAKILIRTASNYPSHDDIPAIETVAGQFRALANTIETRSMPSALPARRTLLTYLALTSLGAVGASIVSRFRSKETISPDTQDGPSDPNPPDAPNPSITRWTMDTFLSDSAKGTILWDAPQTICDQIEAMSGGEFVITLIRSGRTQELLTQVGSGNRVENINENKPIECAYNGIFYASKDYRYLFFGCAVPFGLEAQEQNAWLNYKKDEDGEFTYVQSLYKKFNVIPFPAGSTGTQMGGWFNKEIETTDDFNGLVMRIPGLGAEVLRGFGVIPHTELPNTDGETISIDKAVQRFLDQDPSNKFDSVEWNGPWDDTKLGLSKSGQFYHYPGWWEPCTTFDVQVNIDAYDDLSDRHKEIFRSACSRMHTNMLSEYNNKNAEALIDLVNSKDVKFKRFSDDILKEARTITEDLLDAYATEDKNFKEVYSTWKEFKIRIRGWSKYDLSRYTNDI
jgi:TRAP-type mannitol/chloroaromatic compound transport system substrate-binding protein